jgi:hypothetical protein
MGVRKKNGNVLVGKTKASEVDAYGTLDKFVSWADGSGAARKLSGYR